MVERNGIMQNYGRLKERNPQARHPIILAAFMIVLSLLALGAQGFAGIELNDDLFDVSFPLAKTGADEEQNMGWICGRWGTVLHTQNGGRTWALQTSGTDMTLSGISFVDQAYGWAVGDEGAIIHTKDGGKSWEQQKSPVTNFLMDVCFVDRKTGWIVTERTTILYTSDGGQNWTIQFSDGDFILKAVSFCDTENGWAVGEFGYIYNTKDGGRSWHQQAGNFDISDETGEIVGENFLFDVTAISPSTAWVVGMDGYIARTTDGGTEWDPWTPTNVGIPRTHLFGIASDQSGRLLIAGNAVLLTSAFGWYSDFQSLAAESRLKYGWLYGITRSGPGKFVAVGKGGWIYLVDKDQPTQRVTISR